MAESIALAVLENLVHMPRQDFPTGYVVVTVEIANDIGVLTDEEVRTICGLHGSQSTQVGDAWIVQRLSAVLRVPSVVVSGASNYLFNPGHVEFRRIVVATPVPFGFDARLFG